MIRSRMNHLVMMQSFANESYRNLKIIRKRSTRGKILRISKHLSSSPVIYFENIQIVSEKVIPWQLSR